MTIQYSTTLRNTWLDDWEAVLGTSAKIFIRTGPPPANCAAADSGTLLAEFDLASDWSANASGGAKTLSSLTLSTISVGTGLAGHYRITDSAGTTCHEQGTVTATGGGGDATIDNTSISSGQTVQITAWTKTAPGA
jgi:hypothetical protein